MRVVNQYPGSGFDTPGYLTEDSAKQFFDAGYSVAIRYILRKQQANEKPVADIGGWFYSLSKSEIEVILESGLRISPVQHFGGYPSSYRKGYEIGYNAAYNCKKLGLPEGCTVWVDAEWSGAPKPDEVIQYLRGWGQAVAEYGYLPGVYVGYEGLSGKDWYELPYYQAYWRSAIMYAHEPLPRGWQVIQGLEHSANQTKNGRPPVFGYDIDTDHFTYDNRERLVRVVSR